MIASWFANAAFQIVVGVLALLGVICTPIAVYEGIEINGVSVFGWHISEGLRQKEEDAVRNYNTALGNQKKLQGALDDQNAAVKKLQADNAALKARVDDLVAAAKSSRPEVDKLQAQLGKMTVDHSSVGAAAVSLDDIIGAGVQ